MSGPPPGGGGATGSEDPEQEVVEALDRDRPSWTRLGGMGRDRRWATVAAWVLLALVTAWTCWGTLRHDYRDDTLLGDQASQLLQAVSIAHGANLSYDADDVARYEAASWRGPNRRPAGLFFQRNRTGWAAAKPYGYSVALAPALRALGPTRGAALVNTALLLAVLAVTIALLRLRYDGPVVPLAAGALVFAAGVVPYAYVLYVELFTALVVGIACLGLLKGIRDATTWPLAVGAAAAGLATAEKSSLALVLAPLAVVAVVQARGWWRRVLPVVVGVVVLGVAVAPYAKLSDGHSMSPYGGRRFITTSGQVPFADPPARRGFHRTRTDQVLSPTYAWTALGTGWGDKARSLVTYIFGRHTGVFVFLPMSVMVVALALARARRLAAPAWAILGGLGAYAAFYVLLFTANYFGGDQSYGNRYAVQVLPMAAGLAAVAEVPARRLVIASAAAAVLALALLWPGLVHPSDAVAEIDRTSRLQRLLPLETQEWGGVRFVCGTTTPEAQRLPCEADYRATHGD